MTSHLRREREGIRSLRWMHGATVALALALAWWLKAFYSRAGFEDLLWVLSPTRRAVEWVTGAEFILEPREGYLCRTRMFEIVPACAGVNFMIVAFVSLVCGLVHTRTTPRACALLFVLGAVSSYAVTVLANATRIALAMWLHGGALSGGPLTPSELHCAVGVAVYLVFLMALFTAGMRVTGAEHELAL